MYIHIRMYVCRWIDRYLFRERERERERESYDDDGMKSMIGIMKTEKQITWIP